MSGGAFFESLNEIDSFLPDRWMDLSFDEYIARSPKSLIWPGNKALLWAQEAKEGATDRRPVGDL